MKLSLAKHYKKFLYLIILLNIFLILGQSAVFAAQATAQLTIDATEFSVGDTVQLSLSVSGANPGSRPDLNNTDGLVFQFMGASTQVQIINGKYSSSVMYNYAVTAIKAGQYTIGPFELQAGQEKITTNSININITGSGGNGSGVASAPQAGNDSQSQSAQNSERVYLELDIPKTRLYLGEKIPVKIRLLVGDVTLDEVSYPILDQPEFVFSKFDKPVQTRQIINGRQYQVVEFNTTLSPVKSGAFTLGPVKLNCTAVVRSQARDWFFDDFFNDAQKRPLELKSKKIAMNILPLPSNSKPADFSGGIGRFQLSASVSPNEVLQGDPITVKFTVSGKGNLQTISAPHLVNTAGFKVYAAQKKNLTNQVANGTDEAVFEQVLIPLDAGQKQLGPFVFSYFNPATNQYQNANSGVFPITVKPNPNFKAPTISGGANYDSEQLGHDIVFIKNTPGSLHPKQSRIYTSFWFWLWQLLPIIGIAGAVYYRKYMQMLQGNTPRARATRANNLAIRNTAKIKKLLENGNPDELLDELYRTLREYLGIKYNLPPAGITGSIVDDLKTHGIPPDILTDIKEFFNQYDFYHFTGAKLIPDDARALWKQTERIIKSLNEETSLPGKIKNGSEERRGLNDIN